jgi:hypothetical protein
VKSAKGSRTASIFRRVLRCRLWPRPWGMVPWSQRWTQFPLPCGGRLSSKRLRGSIVGNSKCAGRPRHHLRHGWRRGCNVHRSAGHTERMVALPGADSSTYGQELRNAIIPRAILESCSHEQSQIDVGRNLSRCLIGLTLGSSFFLKPWRDGEQLAFYPGPELFQSITAPHGHKRGMPWPCSAALYPRNFVAFLSGDSVAMRIAAISPIGLRSSVLARCQKCATIPVA